MMGGERRPYLEREFEIEAEREFELETEPEFRRDYRDLPSKLNLGCGGDVRGGWYNVDIMGGPGVDEVYDLEETPWPWPADCAERVLLDNVFEHLHPRTRPAVLRECRRVLADDGTLEMALPVPEVGCGWDVTHYTVPSWRWPLHPEYRGQWRLRSIHASRVGPGRFVPEPTARWLTRHGIARCVDEVRIEVRPR